MLDDAGLFVESFPTCREFFEHVKDGAKELGRINKALVYGVDKKRESVRAALPDPTAGQAIYEAETREAIVSNLTKRRTELETSVGYALVMIDTIRDGLGDVYAFVLEMHYVDCMSWVKIANETGYSKRSCMRFRDIACEWVDSVGAGNVVKGRGISS